MINSIDLVISISATNRVDQDNRANQINQLINYSTTKSMRVFITYLALFLTAQFASAQILEPVKWTFTQNQLSDDEFEIIYTASLDDGWYIYSQYLDGEDGPIPTSFNYEGNSGTYALVGKNEERSSHKKSGYDKLFEMEVIKFSKQVSFVQKVKVTDDTQPVKGYFEFMTCDDARCLPPEEVDFSFTLKKKKTAATPTEDLKIVDKEAIDNNPAKEDSAPAKQAQSGLLDPVKWDMTVEKTGGNTFDLLLKANIQKGWYVYSQFLEGEDGPVPTTLYWDDNDVVKIIGKAAEESKDKVSGFDKMFKMDVTKFKKAFTMRQSVTAADLTKPLTGAVEFMTCDDTRCLPPTEVPFKVDFSSMQALIGNAAMEKTVISPVVAGGDGTVNVPMEGNVIDQEIATIQATYKNPIGDCGAEDNAKGQGLIMTFVFGFLGGLLALLTPCVFPMIPLTVSYFTKSSTNKATGIRNALIYGLSIIVIYVGLGLIITAVFGPEALNALSTNAIANVLFFLVFILFAFSFFGYYEITLPSSWANKSDTMADKGGLVGIFFMAFTLALVSFSCTGPIIGTALVESAKNPSGPLIVMLGFSTALALPFGLFAAFPGWLNSLPKSGGWMSSVKVVLGFLELALALKFLSVADMTMGWGILPYELFVGLWVLIFAATTAYLLGFIKFPHDSPKTNYTPGRLFFTALFGAATLYLATGFMFNEKTQAYNSLAAMSGLAPPAHYNMFLPSPVPNAEIKAKYPSFTKCANNLDCFKDYYEGLAYAKEENLPILLDFTGHGCVNCRKTEEHIWIEDGVWNKIAQDFVLISLYVDDRKKLETELISKSRESKLRNIGNKWADFQIVNFQQNSQPLYVMMSPDESVLAAPRGYKEGADDYLEFLECGLDVFAKKNKGTIGQK
ncbi:MAG: thiol:disulfide interchange protein [Paraglaciecola sp.]|jgi:thiol:disulfide interchange protein